MNIENIYEIFKVHPHICTDSRYITNGCIFFALKGDKFNGNEFANEAIKKGAAYAIIDEGRFHPEKNFIQVDNVLITLQKLATFHRKKLNVPIIAITGTNGKTTTKELLSTVLASKFKVIATKGNLNNHIGVPITLLSMDMQTEFGIVEMGANHQGEIDLLSRIAEPNYGIITNIGKAHLEGFGSFEGIVNTKTELYRYLEKTKGTVFYNSDNEVITNSLKKIDCKKISYGMSENNFCPGRIISSDPFLTFSINRLRGTTSANELKIETKLVGGYNFENALASSCVAIHFGISAEQVKKSISGFEPSNNRSQMLKMGTNELLLDYYNANPTSMEAAITNFHRSKNALTKVLMIGEMFELGEYSDDEHSKLINLIKGNKFENVYLVGKAFMNIKDNPFKTFESSEMLKNYLLIHKIENSFVLIKGSRGIQMEKIIEAFS